MDKGHAPALRSQVFANITSDFKYFGRMASVNDVHNLGVDKLMLLHLLHTFPRINGVLSRRGGLSNGTVSNQLGFMQ
jgi:hypothetical protein